MLSPVLMRNFAARALAFAFFLSLGATPSQGQIPTSPAEAQRLLRENPDLVRQRLLESGLSQAEIRAQLTARGIPSDALDAFLSGAPLDGNTAFDPDALAALELLGVVMEGADGLEVVETISGLQAGEFPDSLASPVFGHDIFRRGSSRFQPLLSGPVPEGYELGPGDRLLLLLTGEVELVHDLEVTREGFVVVPDVGRISIANLDIVGARSLFRDRLSGFYSGIRRGTTSVSLSVTELRTIQVYVAGEARQPGAYQLSSVATLTNALYAADGPTELASLRDIRVRRRDGQEWALDLHPYLLEGDASGDITLEQGDIVFLPLRSRRVQVVGEVIRPKLYDLADGDDVSHVLAAAGGFAAEADRRRVSIYRVVRPFDQGDVNNDRIAIDVSLAPSEAEDAPDFVGGVLIPSVGLQDGDSIVVGRVPAVADGLHVSIAGMVAEPDTFPWRDGMTLRDLIGLARGPLVGADLREAEVSRLPSDRTAGQLVESLFVPMDSSYLERRASTSTYAGAPGLAFDPPGTSLEFVLQPFDRIQIRRQPDFELPKSVIITGEVSVPGSYTLLSQNERLTNLLARAGDPLPSAYPRGAQLFRTELGRVDIDLPGAAESPDGVEDLILQPGDSLHIPEYSPTVVVRGAVNSPVTVLWREDQNFDYYIAAAGGFRTDADEGRSSVRLASGLAKTRSNFLFWSSYPTPDPGSTISVPAKDPSDRLDKVQLTSNLVAILGSLATLFIVIDRTSPN